MFSPQTKTSNNGSSPENSQGAKSQSLRSMISSPFRWNKVNPDSPPPQRNLERDLNDAQTKPKRQNAMSQTLIDGLNYLTRQGTRKNPGGGNRKRRIKKTKRMQKSKKSKKTIKRKTKQNRKTLKRKNKYKKHT
jgi:hypothetical protein